MNSIVKKLWSKNAINNGGGVKVTMIDKYDIKNDIPVYYYDGEWLSRKCPIKSNNWVYFVYTNENNNEWYEAYLIEHLEE